MNAQPRKMTDYTEYTVGWICALGSLSAAAEIFLYDPSHSSRLEPGSLNGQVVNISEGQRWPV